MNEIELKFEVPVASRPAVANAMAAVGTAHPAQRIRLQAHYFDTADARLSAAGVALRLRREGRRWVQTLKALKPQMLQRFEHEVPLGSSAAMPALDVQRHAGTPAFERLCAALGGDATQPLVERFCTDVRRMQRLQRTRDGVVELAYDTGHILVGARRQPLCDLEIELKSGSVQALLDVARRWVRRHDLWIDVRSKAERGERLAQGTEAAGVAVPAVKAMPAAIKPGMTPPQALAAMLQSALGQILPNAAVVGQGGTPDETASAEHVHQLRVGLRRLRSALHLFGAWAADPGAGQDVLPTACVALEARARGPFVRLGAARDRDALHARLLPALAAAGAPGLLLPPAAGDEPPADIVRDPAFSLMVLDTLALAQSCIDCPALQQEALSDVATAARAPSLRVSAASVLRRAHRLLMGDARRFAELEEPLQHRTRKRLKRLRYGVEFLAPLFPAKAVERYLQRLRPAQDALGDYNDILVAQALFQQVLIDDPRAGFALGWLAAQRDALKTRCGKRLQQLDEAPRFWKASALRKNKKD